MVHGGVELDVAWIHDRLGREIRHREHDDQDNQRVMEHAQNATNHGRNLELWEKAGARPLLG